MTAKRLGNFTRLLRLGRLGWGLCLPMTAFAQGGLSAGPLYNQFPLTLESGHRTEAVGPFFFQQERDTEKLWGVPPIFSRLTDPGTESEAYDLFYPLLTYEIYGRQYRWQFCQLLSLAGGPDQTGIGRNRFSLYPLYFQQRSLDTNENYTALVPFYGHLKDRLFRDEIFFVMFPIYSETRKHDVVTDNYLYPFFDLRHGDGLRGWQFWPVVGREHKDVTTHTNTFGETEIIGGHDETFFLWPLYLREDTGIGTDNPGKFRATIPLYAAARSPGRDSTMVLWPFFNWIDDREKKYREWEGPWPFVVIARGPGKTTTRVLPLFGRSHNDTLESDFYLWPVYKHNRLHAGALDQERTRLLFFLFGDLVEKNIETGRARRRVDLLPLFTWHRDFDGNSRLQIFAPIEPVLPGSGGLERNWSPLWSLWRAEDNPGTGATSQLLLWNLYRYDTKAGAKKCSLLFGLFQYQSNAESKKLRLLYIPVVKTHPLAGHPAK